MGEDRLLDLDLEAPTLDSQEEYLEFSAYVEDLRARDSLRWAMTHRVMGKQDLVWLMTEILTTRDWMHPEHPDTKLFLHPKMIETIKELDAPPSSEKGDLHIHPRGYGKTTINSFAKPIKTNLNHPNACMGIWSVTLDISTRIVGQIAEELERNEFLKQLYDEIFFWDPVHESQQWSVERGLETKRTLTLKDPTYRAFGLLDAFGTGARLTHSFYDDCVNEKVTDNPKMIEKANKRWEMSLRLGMPGCERSGVGTFYAAGDTYHHMIDRGVKLHFHSCYEVDTVKSQFSKSGIPVRLAVDRDAPLLFSKSYLENEESLGAKTFAVQMLGIPTAQEVTDFDTERLCVYYLPPKEVRRGMNVLFLVDPAGRRGDESHSRFSLNIVGLGQDQNFYWLDGVLDRLNLAQRIEVMFAKHRLWRPYETRYEANGYNADIEAIEMAMEYRNYRFIITPIFPQGTQKKSRVERLIPIINGRRFYVPDGGIPYHMTDNNQLIDLVEWWKTKELMPFPNVGHLDVSDAMSRIEEPGCVNVWPAPEREPEDPWRVDFYEPDEKKGQILDWMRV